MLVILHITRLDFTAKPFLLGIKGEIMNRQDWIEYFEALNGRSPESHEIEAALVSGEFSDNSVVMTEEVKVEKEEAYSTIESVDDTEAREISYQSRPQMSVNQLENGTPASVMGQAVVASDFTRQVSSYWQWFLAVLQGPLSTNLVYSKKNSYISLTLLSFFAALSAYIPVWKIAKSGTSLFNIFQGFTDNSTRLSNPVDFTLLIKFFFVFILIFAMIIGVTTLVRYFIYGEKEHIIDKNLDIFGRLFTFNTILFAVISLLILLDMYSLAGILAGFNLLLIFSANGFILVTSPDYSGKDRYHKYLMAVVISSLLLFLGIRIAASFGIESMVKNLFNIFNYIK